MTLTLTLGWWLLPTAITIITIGFCFLAFRKKETDPVGVILKPFVASLYYGGAFIISLVSWLVWALLR